MLLLHLKLMAQIRDKHEIMNNESKIDIPFNLRIKNNLNLFIVILYAGTYLLYF